LRDQFRFVNAPERFLILDALRGVLAFVVVLGHLGTPPIFGAIEQSDRLLSGMARLWRTLAFAPPAVIAFFVISGFCIHYPFACAAERKLPVLRFYLRRYLRIGIPVVAIVALLQLMEPGAVVLGENSVLWRSTLWSVLCEEIYYALYPLLLLARRYVGMGSLLSGAALFSIAVIALTFPAVDWSDLGVVGASTVLLPVWLLGAVLAEEVKSGQLPLSKHIDFRVGVGWWRVGAWGVMWLALVMHFHGGLHQTATGLIVGAFAFMWLNAELANAATPNACLIWLGAWSYSLYLMHPLVISYVVRNGLDAHASLASWALTMALIIGFSYLFYVLVESPSHALARKVSLRAPEAPGLAAQKSA
jgi:peptidoglycan/LPS O-acetylase OafA/YrhL